MTYEYSPHPVTAYMTSDTPGRCEASWIAAGEEPLALWNLFWLSNPDVDVLPGATKGWWLRYQPRTGLLAAVVKDLFRDQRRMSNRLTGHPLAFRVWFDEQDHTGYSLWHAMGGQAWVDNVIRRADQAAERHPITYRPTCPVVPLRLVRP